MQAADTSTPAQGDEEGVRTLLCVPSVPPLLSSELAELESDCRNARDCRVGRFEPDDEPVRSTSSATAATPKLSATARLLGLRGYAARGQIPRQLVRDATSRPAPEGLRDRPPRRTTPSAGRAPPTGPAVCYHASRSPRNAPDRIRLPNWLPPPVPQRRRPARPSCLSLRAAPPTQPG